MSDSSGRRARRTWLPSIPTAAAGASILRLTSTSPATPSWPTRSAELFPALGTGRGVQARLRRSDRQLHPAAVARRSRAALERLGDFRILREIGRGGMGVVYEAEQESLGRRVALKVLPGSRPGSTPSKLQRFHREAQAAAQLHHTNIVPVFGVGEDDGRPLLRHAVHRRPGPGRGPARRQEDSGRKATAGQGSPTPHARPAEPPHGGYCG